MDWPSHKIDCNEGTDINPDDARWVLNSTSNPGVFKKLKNWDIIHGPVVLWAIQQAYMQNLDLDPREHRFSLLLETDHVGGFPSRLRPVGVIIQSATGLATTIKGGHGGTHKLLYGLNYVDSVTGNIHELIAAKVVPSSWKQELEVHEGVFDMWSYIFFYTCFANSLTKRTAVLRANLLIEASRSVCKTEDERQLFREIFGETWEHQTTSMGLFTRNLRFSLRPLWGSNLDAFNVWEIMEKSGKLAHILENSCDVVDYNGSLETVQYSGTRCM
ncbi:hypothetical protein M408DRAFT_25985 [Serendipita vermifera MAFF 305830]|uniref:Uncharacterized protein n=1 Tax=Serendipita vermifera MAFF 305830 TaxID=933852 RepID=A0A0C3B2D0_SERVB|nr:hypothetical protein M408DRAFT_25985 [Serendipita vermifera MAFF 305830]